MSNYKFSVLKKKPKTTNQQTHCSNKKQPSKTHNCINSSAFTHRSSWAYFIYVTTFAPQMLATTVPLWKAMVIVANTSRAETSILIESTTWLAPLLALNFYRRGYIARNSSFEWSQDHQKLYHCYAGNCLIASEPGSKLIWRRRTATHRRCIRAINKPPLKQ